MKARGSGGEEGLTAAFLRRYEKRVIRFRRDLHRIPEPGFEEHKTTAYVQRVLSRAGIPFRSGVARTGVVAEIRGGAPGPAVLLRADMDAVAVAEEKTGEPFSSRHPGMMHACGHDAHTAMLLGTGLVLNTLRREMKGKVILVFQPAEEGRGGGKEVVSSGAVDFDRVTAAVALHVWGSLPAGTFGWREGPAFAGADEFVVTVRGRGGHGSTPHLVRDPVLPAARLITALHTLVGTRVPPGERAVITVGAVNGGEAFNVVPDRVVVKGSVRTYTAEVRRKLHAEIRRAVLHAARAGGVEAECSFMPGYPVLRNDPGVVRRGREIAERIFGAGNVKEVEPLMAAEDFAFFLQKARGAMFLLGAAPPGGGPVLHHGPEFRIDEGVLVKGVEFLCRFALRCTAGRSTRGGKGSRG